MLLDQARLVCVTRWNKLQESRPTDQLLVFWGFVEAQLHVEYAQLQSDLSGFQAVWCVGHYCDIIQQCGEGTCDLLLSRYSTMFHWPDY